MSILVLQSSRWGRERERACCFALFVFLVSRDCCVALTRKFINPINFIYNRLFYCNHTCYCVNMVFVTSASRYITSASGYHPRYQRRSSMFIRGLIPRNFAESVEAVPIASPEEFWSYFQILSWKVNV